ncbi:MAG: hypothetical protein Q8O87_00170 [bacterium]|nr:hypothetical protein [bacterium]
MCMRAVTERLDKLDDCMTGAINTWLDISSGEAITDDGEALPDVSDKYRDFVVERIARRLIVGDRAQPLFSNKDFIDFLPVLLEDFEDAGFGLEEEHVEILRDSLAARDDDSFVQGFFQMTGIKDPYEVCYKWISSVQTIANEHGLTVVGLMSNPEGVKAVTRHIYPTEADYRRDQDEVVGAIVADFIAMGHDVEMISEIRRAVESFIDQEVAVIYG